MPKSLFTIGHSNHTWELFLPLLRLHAVELVVDVRSNPVSRFAPFANKRRLPALLSESGVRYLWMGDCLGGKPSDPALLDDEGTPDYSKISLQPAFAQGVTELLELADDAIVALMCAEEDPRKCHRSLLIGPALAAQGVAMAHIRRDGSVMNPIAAF